MTGQGTCVLYGSIGSGSAAIEIALRQCALRYRVVRASSWEPDSAQQALQRLNPLGQVPTLVLPGGIVMSESAAILIHLGLTVPGGNLLPPEPAARALNLRGLVYLAANCYPAVGVSDHPERWTTARSAAAHAQVRKAARARLHQAWEIFADLFPASPFLAGQAPGALDFLAVVVSRWSGTRAHLAQARPAFCETLARIEADPPVNAVLRKHWP